MNKNKIKKLAELVSSERGVNSKVSEFILNKLTRKELVFFLSYLKSYSVKNTVFVNTTDTLNADLKGKIEKIFTGKRIVYEKDLNDSGIKVRIEDTVIDLTVKNYINSTIEKLKNTL